MDDQRDDFVSTDLLDADHVAAPVTVGDHGQYSGPIDAPHILHAPLPLDPPTPEPIAAPQRRAHSPTTTYRSQPDPGAITVAWTLAELPSAQHRAGLAGLALLVEHTRRFPLPPNATLDIQRLDDQGLALRLDRAGLTALFDRVYAASLVDSNRRRPSTAAKNRRSSPTSLVPVAESTMESQVATSRERRLHPAQGHAPSDPASASSSDSTTATATDDQMVVPDGGPLRDWSPPGDGGAWLRLWQHCLWSVLRAIPQQRWPYQLRARAALSPKADPNDPASPPRDVLESWAGLCGDLTARMASTHFLGAMDANAECIPFLERSRRLFLLHFWPFVAQIFVPYASGTAPGAYTARGPSLPALRNHSGDDDAVTDGYALCIPDIVRLAAFVRLHPRVMRSRPAERVHWRPRAAHIALGAAAAAQVERWMRAQNSPAWDGGADRIVAGFQIIEAARDGHNVRILANRMVDPTPALIGALGTTDTLQCPHLRRLVLGNALSDRAWWNGGDRLCTTLPTTRTLGDPKFRSDLFALFSRSPQRTSNLDQQLYPPTPATSPVVRSGSPRTRTASTSADPDSVSPDESSSTTPRDLEAVIFAAVQQWLDSRLSAARITPPTARHELPRDNSGDLDPGLSAADIPRSPVLRPSDRRKIAGTAFHAARRRTTARDFTAWFVATFGALLSSTSAAPKSLIIALAREPDHVRTLTLLALAADPADTPADR